MRVAWIAGVLVVATIAPERARAQPLAGCPDPSAINGLTSYVRDDGLGLLPEPGVHVPPGWTPPVQSPLRDFLVRNAPTPPAPPTNCDDCEYDVHIGARSVWPARGQECAFAVVFWNYTFGSDPVDEAFTHYALLDIDPRTRGVRLARALAPTDPRVRGDPRLPDLDGDGWPEAIEWSNVDGFCACPNGDAGDHWCDMCGLPDERYLTIRSSVAARPALATRLFADGFVTTEALGRRTAQLQARMSAATHRAQQRERELRGQNADQCAVYASTHGCPAYGCDVGACPQRVGPWRRAVLLAYPVVSRVVDGIVVELATEYSDSNAWSEVRGARRCVSSRVMVRYRITSTGTVVREEDPLPVTWQAAQPIERSDGLRDAPPSCPPPRAPRR